MTYQNDLYVELAKIGKSLSSERRLEIMDLLVQGPKTVEKIAVLLDVPLETSAATAHALPSGPSAVNAHAYCPHADCFSNVPYVVDGELLFWPRAQADSHAAAAHCAVCGELLERRCPHCGAAVTTAGACCPACGGARIPNTLPPETDCESWAAQRRRAIAEWRSLIL